RPEGARADADGLPQGAAGYALPAALERCHRSALELGQTGEAMTQNGSGRTRGRRGREHADRPGDAEGRWSARPTADRSEDAVRADSAGAASLGKAFRQDDSDQSDRATRRVRS